MKFPNSKIMVDIELVEELPLGLLVGKLPKTLQLGLLAEAVVETLNL